MLITSVMILHAFFSTLGIPCSGPVIAVMLILWAIFWNMELMLMLKMYGLIIMHSCVQYDKFQFCSVQVGQALYSRVGGETWKL
jgi:hypothetical protein